MYVYVAAEGKPRTRTLHRSNASYPCNHVPVETPLPEPIALPLHFYLNSPPCATAKVTNHCQPPTRLHQESRPAAFASMLLIQWQFLRSKLIICPKSIPQTWQLYSTTRLQDIGPFCLIYVAFLTLEQWLDVILCCVGTKKGKFFWPPSPYHFICSTELNWNYFFGFLIITHNFYPCLFISRILLVPASVFETSRAVVAMAAAVAV